MEAGLAVVFWQLVGENFIKVFSLFVNLICGDK